MADDLLLVELYAGLASLTLGFFGAKPPLGRRGSKAGYAGPIAAALFGDRRPARFLLNDADEGVANALRVLFDAELRLECAAQLDEAAGRRSIELWPEWERASFAADPAREAARWLFVSAGSAMSCYGSGPRLRLSKVPRDARDGEVMPSARSMAASLRATPATPGVTVRHGPAETIEPIAGAVAYLDPPYVGTQGYERSAVVAPKRLAERWARAGCRVGLSEMSPAAAPLGWRARDLAPDRVGKWRKTTTNGRRELLFLSP